MNYQLMAKLSGTYSVEKMARVLSVSRSGYYAWMDRPESARMCQKVELTEQIRGIQRRSTTGMELRGSQRTRTARTVGGTQPSSANTARKGLGARPKRRFRVTTKSAQGPVVAENKLDRHFSASAVNQKWVSDITYVATASIPLTFQSP